MSDELYAKALSRQKQLEYASFSDYIRALIRADALQSGPHIRETAHSGPAAQPPSKPVTYRKSSRKGTHHKIPDIVKKGVEKERSAQSQPKPDA